MDSQLEIIMIIDEVCNDCRQNFIIMREGKTRYLRCDCGIQIKFNVIDAKSLFENARLMHEWKRGRKRRDEK